MVSEQLGRIIESGESETIEFKLSFNKAVLETIVAFSNSKGGKIFIGVDDSAEMKGIAVSKETPQKWINEIKQNTEPSIIPDFKIFKKNRETTVILSVDEFPLKPVSFKNRYYIRQNNSNHTLKIDEIALLKFNSLNYSFDSFEVNSTFGELNKNALLTFTEKIKNSGRYHSSGDIEKYGTGYKRIREWFSEYPELDLKLLDLHGFIQVEITATTTIDSNEPLNEPLNTRQKKIIEQIKSNKSITINELAGSLNVGRETIKRDLKYLRASGIVERLGSDKTG